MNTCGSIDSEEIYNSWKSFWRDRKNHNMTPVGKLITKSKQKALRKLIKNSDFSRAIDVGCGLGFTSTVFKEMGLDVVGIDISETAVEVCRDKGLNVLHKKLEDVTNSYDLVFSDGLIEHFPDFKPCARHLMRISSDSVLLIQTDHDSLIIKLLLFLENLLKRNQNVLECDHRIGEFISIFKENGFQLISVNGIFMNSLKLLLFRRR